MNLESCMLSDLLLRLLQKKVMYVKFGGVVVLLILKTFMVPNKVMIMNYS